MKKRLLFLFLFLFSSLVQASDPLSVYQNQGIECTQKDISKTISLSDAYEIAICNNPSLRAKYLSSMISASEYGQSLSSYLPSVSLNAGLDQGYRHEDGGLSDNSTDVSANISLDYLLLDFGGRRASVNKFQALLSSSQYQYDTEFQDMLYTVAEGYYQLLSANENADALKVTLDSYKKSYEVASRRYDLGLVKLSDKLQAETSMAQADLNLTLAQKNVSLKSGQLAKILNVAQNTQFKLKKTDPNLMKESLKKFDELIAEALENRPDYLSYQKQMDALKQDIDIIKSSGKPTLKASLGVSATDEINGQGRAFYSGNIGLGVSVPIFTGFKNTYQISGAQYNYEKAQKELEKIKSDIENDVWTAVLDYNTSYQTHQISKTLLKSAKESERVALASYEVGHVDILTLLDAQSSLASARVEYISSFYNFLISKSNMMRALGKMGKKS